MILLKKLQDGVVMKVEKMFDIVALGEVLIDFTFQGYNDDGQRLFATESLYLGHEGFSRIVSPAKLVGQIHEQGAILSGKEVHVGAVVAAHQLAFPVELLASRILGIAVLDTVHAFVDAEHRIRRLRPIAASGQ